VLRSIIDKVFESIRARVLNAPSAAPERAPVQHCDTELDDHCQTKMVRSERRAVAASSAFRYLTPHAPVAQLDGALPSEGGGLGFESLRARHSRQLNAKSFVAAEGTEPACRGSRTQARRSETQPATLHLLQLPAPIFFGAKPRKRPLRFRSHTFARRTVPPDTGGPTHRNRVPR
jgi:hypothetical protein